MAVDISSLHKITGQDLILKIPDYMTLDFFSSDQYTARLDEKYSIIIWVCWVFEKNVGMVIDTLNFFSIFLAFAFEIFSDAPI